MSERTRGQEPPDESLKWKPDMDLPDSGPYKGKEMKDLLESAQETTARLNRQVKPHVPGMAKKLHERTRAEKAAQHEAVPPAAPAASPAEKPRSAPAPHADQPRTAQEHAAWEMNQALKASAKGPLPKPVFRDVAWSDEEEVTAHRDAVYPPATSPEEVNEPELAPPVAEATPEIAPAVTHDPSPEAAPKSEHPVVREFEYPSDAEGLKALSNREWDRHERLNERLEAQGEQLNNLELEAMRLALEFSLNTATEADRRLADLGFTKEMKKPRADAVPEAAAPVVAAVEASAPQTMPAAEARRKPASEKPPQPEPKDTAEDEPANVERDRAAEQARMLFEEYGVKPGFTAKLTSGEKIRVSAVEDGVITLFMNDGDTPLRISPDEYGVMLDSLPAPHETWSSAETTPKPEPKREAPLVDAKPAAEPDPDLSPEQQRADAHMQELTAGFAEAKNPKEMIAAFGAKVEELETAGRLTGATKEEVTQALDAVLNGAENVAFLDGMNLTVDNDAEAPVDLRMVATDLIVNRIAHLKDMDKIIALSRKLDIGGVMANNLRSSLTSIKEGKYAPPGDFEPMASIVEHANNLRGLKPKKKKG